MKIRTLFITAASVIALSSTAMADDHLFEALQHGLQEGSQGDLHGDPAPGQGSPFSGGDTHTPASATIEDNPHVPSKIVKERCDPPTSKCQLQIP